MASKSLLLGCRIFIQILTCVIRRIMGVGGGGRGRMRSLLLVCRDVCVCVCLKITEGYCSKPTSNDSQIIMREKKRKGPPKPGTQPTSFALPLYFAFCVCVRVGVLNMNIKFVISPENQVTGDQLKMFKFNSLQNTQSGDTTPGFEAAI